MERCWQPSWLITFTFFRTQEAPRSFEENLGIEVVFWFDAGRTTTACKNDVYLFPNSSTRKGSVSNGWQTRSSAAWFVDVWKGKQGLQEGCLSLPDTDDKLAVLHLPALSAVLTVFAQEHEFMLVSRLKGPFRVNTSVVELYCPLECVVASSPTLEESYLSKEKGGDPRTGQTRKGTNSDPGLASRRDCVLTASASRPEAVGVGTPRVTGPLTTSHRGLWVSGLLSPGNGGTSKRAATREPTKRRKGTTRTPGWHPEEKAT